MRILKLAHVCFVVCMVTLVLNAQGPPATKALEVTDHYSKVIGSATVTIPADKFRRHFRAIDAAIGLGIQEMLFADAVTVTFNGVPVSARIGANYFDNDVPAIWFEWHDARHGRAFTEPLTERDLQQRK